MDPVTENSIAHDTPTAESAGSATNKTSAVQNVSSANADRAIATLTLAFAADPGVRWLLPETGSYREAFPLFARAFGGQAFALGTAHSTAQGRAVALWLPPGAGPDEQALVDVIQRFAPGLRHAEAFELFERMGRLHPNVPHWYLPLIGTEPLAQGCGFGSALLGHALAQCDALRLPAYLEATSERNVPLYRRHGFEVLEVLRVGTCPPITPMLRRPHAF